MGISFFMRCENEIAQDMYPVRGMDRDIYPIKKYRPAYIYRAINKNCEKINDNIPGINV